MVYKVINLGIFVIVLLIVPQEIFSSNSIRNGIRNGCRPPLQNLHQQNVTMHKLHEVVCHGTFLQTWNSSGLENNVQVLTLRNWQEEELDAAALLLKFHALKRFNVIGGNLTRLITPFPKENHVLECIKITGTKLRELPDFAFANLPDLKVLDLRGNDFSEIYRQPFTGISSSLRQFFLSGNPWKCVDSMTWVLDPEVSSLTGKIADKEELRCFEPHKGRPLIPVLEVLQKLAEECQLIVCDCELVYVVGPLGSGKHIRQFLAFTSVNCSYRELTEMPEFLPDNTTSLHLENNKISDLTPLKTNPAYKRVLDLYLDNNLLESVELLDGTYWLEQFRVLSLRGNMLTDLPTYALENVLLTNENAVSLYLGYNPWTCDCHFTPGFQELLIRHTKLVKDVNDIRCSPTGREDNVQKSIRELTRTEICISLESHYWLYPLDALNVILVMLILAIIGKLLYDYWSFKRTGKLPWLVSHIP